QAATLVDSLIAEDDRDLLITDPTASFYTRIGVIAMSDTAEVLYSLNMTKTDKMSEKVNIKAGISEIDVVDAFQAAVDVFDDGIVSQPYRAIVRHVIYYMTDSDPKTKLPNFMENFKESQGVIIVNNFVKDGVTERPGLKNLASEGYYFTDLHENVMKNMQVFCKGSYFSKCETVLFQQTVSVILIDILMLEATLRRLPMAVAITRSHTGASFSNARWYCASHRGGTIAVAHD
ncbi:hypothetical protein PMAYCL1PPCAC_05915, partial [Pristionchus mayeri]